MKILFLTVLMSFMISWGHSLPAHAVDSDQAEETTQKYTTRQVGGLLFDTDEGVAVEQGPGGSVYVKSNREYMQKKFKEIDQHFESLETRLVALESKLAEKKEGPRKTSVLTTEASKTGEGSEEKPQEDDDVAGEILGRRVLAT